VIGWCCGGQLLWSCVSGRPKTKILDVLQSTTAKQRPLEEMQSKTPLDLSSKPPLQASEAAQLRVGLRTMPNILLRRKPLPPPQDDGKTPGQDLSLWFFWHPAEMII